MSNYYQRFLDKETHEVVNIYCIDDYFDRHLYGYQIPNGDILTEEEFSKLYETVVDVSVDVNINNIIVGTFVLDNEISNHLFNGGVIEMKTMYVGGKFPVFEAKKAAANKKYFGAVGIGNDTSLIIDNNKDKAIKQMNTELKFLQKSNPDFEELPFTALYEVGDDLTKVDRVTTIIENK